MTLILIGIVNYFLFRKYIHSILDPLFLSIFLTTFAQAVVLFLYFTGNISNVIFLSFCLTEVFFLLGLFTFQSVNPDQLIKNQKQKETKIKDEQLFTELFFVISSLVFIASQLYVYKTKGIPLLMASRLEVYSEGSGFGILSRILSVAGTINLFLVFHFLYNIKRTRIKAYFNFVLLFTIVSLLLGGSKSAFLNVVFVFFTFNLFNLKYNKRNFFSYLKKYQYKLILVGTIFALLTIMVQSRKEKGALNPVLALSYRFIDTGGIYWFSYPNDKYQIVDDSKPLQVLFTDFLGFFRIVDWNDMPQNAGLVLIRHHHPEVAKHVTGPNMRHNVFGLIYFGFWGSIIFSFLIGLTVSFIRNYLFKILPNNFLGGLIFTLLYLNGLTLATDPLVVLSFINNVVFVFPVLFLITFALYYLILQAFRDNRELDKQVNYV